MRPNRPIRYMGILHVYEANIFDETIRSSFYIEFPDQVDLFSSWSIEKQLTPARGTLTMVPPSPANSKAGSTLYLVV